MNFCEEKIIEYQSEANLNELWDVAVNIQNKVKDLVKRMKA